MIKLYSLSVDTIELILTHSREFVYCISVHQVYVYTCEEKNLAGMVSERKIYSEPKAIINSDKNDTSKNQNVNLEI